MPACFPSVRHWRAYLFAHSFVQTAPRCREAAEATTARIAAAAALREYDERMEVAGLMATPADALEGTRLRAALAEARRKEFAIRVALAEPAASMLIVCGDCAHEFQQRMIRQRRCVNPARILPGSPCHAWTKAEMLPEGMEA